MVRCAVVPDAVRARILAGAEERFLSFGFTAVTMGDLAGELGMSKKTLYLVFAGKQALLNAVLDQRLSRVAARMKQIMDDPKTSFPTKLERLLAFLTEAMAEVKPPFLRDLKRHAPASFERIESVRQKLIPLHFGRLVAEGKRHARGITVDHHATHADCITFRV